MTDVRFKPYPEYKDSGIEWLGEIPAHWEIQRLRHTATLNPSKREISSVPRDSEVAFLPMSKVSETGELTFDETKEIGEVFEGYTYFRDNDVLIAKITPCFENGKAAVANNLTGGCGFGSTEFHVLRPHKGKDSRFLYYVVFSDPFRRIGTARMTGAAGQQRVPEQFVLDWAQPFPDLAEQQAIADFLDRETAKIDALVEKKERLIELLKEKRTALISHAVTKGLDPNVPMKDSGIEWLGKIPPHWDILRLKHILESRKSALKTGPFGSQLQSSDMSGDAIKVYNQKNVIKGDIGDGDNYISMRKFEELKAFEVFENDLLVTTRGTIGHCMVVPPGAERGILHPCLMRIQSDKRRILNRYLEILIQDSGLVLNQLRFMSNATTIDVIYSQTLSEVWLAVPPIFEQQAIADFLDRETTKIGALIAKVEKAIELLKEYRTALISAAVTGKIDVRNE